MKKRTQRSGSLWMNRDPDERHPFKVVVAGRTSGGLLVRPVLGPHELGQLREVPRAYFDKYYRRDR